MSNDDKREDLLSILQSIHRTGYSSYRVFIVQVIIWCILVYWWESTSGEHTTDPLGRVIATGLKMAPLTGLSAITAIVLVDIWRYLVVLLPTPSTRRKIMEKAKAEGMAAERRNWVAWNNRRKEAEAQGLPFDEPPPGDDESPE